MIMKYFELCTEISKERLAEHKSQLDSGDVNPRDIKRELARDIVSIYHDENKAKEAEQNFDKLFIKKDIPWAHLDIAGVTWTKKASVEGFSKLHSSGATAFGVRLIDQFLKS